MSGQVDDFLEHFGVKGMKKPVSPQKLGRVYRVASGTAALKDKIQQARQANIKKVITPPVDDQNGDITPDGEDTDAASDVILGEALAKMVLNSCGATKVTMLG